MTKIAMRDLGGEYARIFGPRDDLDSAPGRSRKCKVCGGWHRLEQPWPHNCRSEAPPRADFPTPQLAPSFQPFMTGPGADAEYIGSRNDKRQYMERNDLAEYDAGVGRRNEWVEEIEQDRELVQTIKRTLETDPLELPPMEHIGETDLDTSGTEIITEDIEVAK